MSKNKKSTPRPLSAIEQIRYAGKSLPAILLACGVCSVPVFVYTIAHEELDTSHGFRGLLSQLLFWAVLGGLVFSAKTVWQWTNVAFRDPIKATGYVVLLEVIMTCSNIKWITLCALFILVAVNGIASACNFAQDDKGKGVTKAKRRSSTASNVQNIKSGKRPVRKAA